MAECELFSICNCKTAMCRVTLPDEDCYWYRYFKQLIKKNHIKENNMYNADYDYFTPRGWVCPKCGRVYSPSTPTCFYCGSNNSPNIVDDTTAVDDNWWKQYQNIANMSTWPFVGGSDYWDDTLKTYTNIVKNVSNKKEK